MYTVMYNYTSSIIIPPGGPSHETTYIPYIPALASIPILTYNYTLLLSLIPAECRHHYLASSASVPCTVVCLCNQPSITV